MKHLEQIFKFKRYLDAFADVKVFVTGYNPAVEKIENGVLYKYPETFEIKIENWSNHFYSVRASDGRWIREGRNLTGKGQRIGEIYASMRSEAKGFQAHKDALTKSKLSLVGAK